MATNFDAIVIGAGQAGPSLATRLANSGLKVAFIERKLFGGTCVNTGCTPTKAMVASAYAAQLARRAADYGVNLAGDIKIDMRKVKARKDQIVHNSSSSVETWLRGNKNIAVFTDHARLVGPKEVNVGGSRLSADKIFINVGGRARVPKMPGIDQISYLTNSSMMDVDFLPRHLVIIGGSYIGLEFGQMFRRFGSEVTIIEMGPRLIGREDPDISAEVEKIFENEGINIRLNATCISFRKDGDSIAAGVDCERGAPEVAGSHVLLAVGRVPNTDDLGLDQAGIATDKHGFITVDDQLRTNVPGIWALGDCNGKGAFTHTSYYDYEIVAANLLDNDPRKVSDRISTYGLFIDPPLGRAGMTEAEALAAGHKVLIGKRAMTRVARAIEKGETQGFMKVLVDADSKEILGAAVLGPGGDEAIHCVLDVMYSKRPYTVIQRAMHIHPTVAELIPTILGELQPIESYRAQGAA